MAEKETIRYTPGECLLGDIVGFLFISAIFNDPNHPGNVFAYFFLGKAVVLDGPRFGWKVLRASASQAFKNVFHAQR